MCQASRLFVFLVRPGMLRAYDSAGRKVGQLFGTCGLFKEWVVLLFETNPFKETVLLRNLQEWKVLWRALLVTGTSMPHSSLVRAEQILDETSGRPDDLSAGQENAASLFWVGPKQNYPVLCAMRTSIGSPFTAFAIVVTIFLISAGTGPDGISSISNFMA